VGAQSALRLSQGAEISVITCGPGHDELYSAFGHSAIRVSDPRQELDLAFNYGVFDFNQPNFYLNFARGYLFYKLGVHDYQHFEQHYIEDDRYVHEQVLNLSASQKQRLMDSLSWNSLPENEGYLYDYFYDNCATKVPAVIKKVFGDSVTFDGSYVKTEYTIRELTDFYLDQQPWGDLGIDICLGLPMDKKITPYEYMFLPDYVESGFDHATILIDGKPTPLVKEKVIKHKSASPKSGAAAPVPFILFSVLCTIVIFISVRDFRVKRISVWIDAILLVATGLIGILLLFLWLFTDHDAAARNLNIFWAIPTHIIAAVALIRRPKWLTWYFGATFLISVVLLLSWAFLPQQLHYALIPIVISIAVRGFVNFRIGQLR
jgi:hypothetical protein